MVVLSAALVFPSAVMLGCAISDALRINTNTVMAGVKTPKQALDEIEQRVARALR